MTRLKTLLTTLLAAALALTACAPAATPTVAAPAADSPKQWSTPPEMTIDVNKSYTATIVTAKGNIVIELMPKVAPKTVNNFVFLARQGYYDGVIFHRVIKDFMAQGGDPTGTGMGGPGYQFEDEFSPDVTFSQAGLLAMANAGAGTNGSQFFITYVPTPHLNGAHTIFGTVVAGLEVALALTERDPQDPNAPPGDVMTTITIDEK
ncbi:MAG TPA: peptidylprolyl isomerase [Anaerolineales bacterium]|nr:peptidylprolyl isomerase [Anaerolineales bacterium]